MNAADRRRLTPSLGIAAAVLLLALVVLWLGLGRGTHWHDHASPPKLPPTQAGLPPPLVAPQSEYASVWQNPLFSPTRRPEAVASGNGAAASDLTLTGVIMMPGLHLAIVHDKAHNQDYRLVEGQPSREGPVLVSLQPRSAVVEASGGRVELQLVPGISPDAGKRDAARNARAATSGIVTRQGSDGGAPTTQGSTAAARARALKARIEAERRRAGQREDGN